jgi:hypothetical protein
MRAWCVSGFVIATAVVVGLTTVPLAFAMPAGADELARAARQTAAQALVDNLRSRLSIPYPVVVSVVPHDDLTVSVRRAPDRTQQTFSLSIEDAFLQSLSQDELRAAMAHELGHVWIFTHHPYLQTEELANEVALRVVTRDSLEALYVKVWTRHGKGDLVYLPADGLEKLAGAQPR